MELLLKTTKMKTQNNFFRKALGFLFFISVSSVRVYSQSEESSIKNSIENKQFVFEAQTAIPSSGISRQLTSLYDLKVSKNSVVSSLPFFGRAYSLPYGSTEGGFNFTSNKFDYSVVSRKKGGWDISIKPKDIQDFREFSLSISENGFGTLQALSNNRQPISFTGRIMPIK